ncbi:DC1 [Dillenia turbinata]|uniref:DC1 n=1 Tax=Dillenia turbinata TaxID=194707 RepID=A0AAN8USP0_9MAGN
MRGGPCTGKTKLARALSEALNASLISVEDIRDSIPEITNSQGSDFHRDLKFQKQVCYKLAWGVARAQLKLGLRVVIDSPLMDDSDDMIDFADETDAAVLVIECIPSDRTMWMSWVDKRVNGENSGWYRLVKGEDLKSQMVKYGDSTHDLILFGHSKIAVDTTLFKIEEQVSTVIDFINSDHQNQDSNYGDLINQELERLGIEDAETSRDVAEKLVKQWKQMVSVTEDVQSLEEREIHRHCHHHELSLSDYREENSVCKLCSGTISDGQRSYSCKDCGYFLHESCGNLPLPNSIELEFHDQPLALARSTKTFTCNVCNLNADQEFYCCSRCFFIVHIKCALLPAAFNPEPEWHNHSLVLSVLENSHFICQACGESGQKASYKCSHSTQCDIFFHIKCALLPSKVKHELKHPCWFKLKSSFERDDVFCDKCEEGIKVKHSAYYCEDCDYTYHLSCVAGDDFWGFAAAANHAYAILQKKEEDQPNSNINEV